jgi:fructose-bisphosphate aldolase class II
MARFAAILVVALAAAADAFSTGRWAGRSTVRMSATATKLPTTVKPGVVTGKAFQDLLQYAQDNEFAIPGVNIVGTNSINACMEAAAKAGGPIMVTFSRGGGQFIAGKAANNDDDAACIAGAVAGAKHVREVAALYGVPVILHTDHCCKVRGGLREWIGGGGGLGLKHSILVTRSDDIRSAASSNNHT